MEKSIEEAPITRKTDRYEASRKKSAEKLNHARTETLSPLPKSPPSWLLHTTASIYCRAAIQPTTPPPPADPALGFAIIHHAAPLPPFAGVAFPILSAVYSPMATTLAPKI
jgi:hypothetical protein